MKARKPWLRLLNRFRDSHLIRSRLAANRLVSPDTHLPIHAHAPVNNTLKFGGPQAPVAPAHDDFIFGHRVVAVSGRKGEHDLAVPLWRPSWHSVPAADPAYLACFGSKRTFCVPITLNRLQTTSSRSAFSVSMIEA